MEERRHQCLARARRRREHQVPSRQKLEQCIVLVGARRQALRGDPIGETENTGSSGGASPGSGNGGSSVAGKVPLLISRSTRDVTRRGRLALPRITSSIPSPECLQSCGGIAGYCAELCRVGPRPNCGPSERIDELACVVALLAISPPENSSPVHPATPSPGIPPEFVPGPRVPASSVTDCHSNVTALRRAKPEA